MYSLRTKNITYISNPSLTELIKQFFILVKDSFDSSQQIFLYFGNEQICCLSSFLKSKIKMGTGMNSDPNYDSDDYDSDSYDSDNEDKDYEISTNESDYHIPKYILSYSREGGGMGGYSFFSFYDDFKSLESYFKMHITQNLYETFWYGTSWDVYTDTAHIDLMDHVTFHIDGSKIIDRDLKNYEQYINPDSQCKSCIYDASSALCYLLLDIERDQNKVITHQGNVIIISFPNIKKASMFTLLPEKVEIHLKF